MNYILGVLMGGITTIPKLRLERADFTKRQKLRNNPGRVILGTLQKKTRP